MNCTVWADFKYMYNVFTTQRRGICSPNEFAAVQIKI